MNIASEKLFSLVKPFVLRVLSPLSLGEGVGGEIQMTY
jgi:hypothetical protein